MSRSPLEGLLEARRLGIAIILAELARARPPAMLDGSEIHGARPGWPSAPRLAESHDLCASSMGMRRGLHTIEGQRGSRRPCVSPRSRQWSGIGIAGFAGRSAADRCGTTSASPPQTTPQTPCTRAECSWLPPALRCPKMVEVRRPADRQHIRAYQLVKHWIPDRACVDRNSLDGGGNSREILAFVESARNQSALRTPQEPGHAARVPCS